MPELPEVETVRRGLERLLVGRRLTELVVRETKSWQVDPALTTLAVIPSPSPTPSPSPAAPDERRVPSGVSPTADSDAPTVGAAPVGSSPVGSTPTGSTPVGSTPTGSTPTGATPIGSTPTGATLVGATPVATPPASSSPGSLPPAGPKGRGDLESAAPPLGLEPPEPAVLTDHLIGDRPPAPALSLDPVQRAVLADHLIGARVTAARRRAKVLILDLDDACSLVCHLKMTGQMVVRGEEDWGAGHPTDSLLARLPDRSTRLEFGFEDGWRLFFNDQRKFGWVRLMPTAAVERLPFIAALGPEPFDPAGFAEFRRRIARHGRTSIKAALLDQSVVAGIGNIYADESLWAGRVHPARPVAEVSPAKLRQLWRAAAEVMGLSIDLGGSTDRNYVDAEGKRGSYLGFANVFRREGQPCRRCGAIIVKTRVAGRGTHLCPHCQRR